MARLAAAVDEVTGRRVIAGPFKGMNLSQAVSGSYIPKCLGCYECELHEVIESALKRGYATLIDVGAGEGYYAVGMAMQTPDLRVYAFDTNPAANEACRQQAELNGVAERVTIRGACELETLQDLPLENALLICDCEGFETTLLCDASAPYLERTDILVEMHELFSPGVTEQMLRVFAPTHHVALISSRLRDPDAYPALSSLKRNDRIVALNESRYGTMQWAWMTCKA